MMSRAVERGLERRQLEAMKHFGMDEKSFGRGAVLHHPADRFGAITGH
jgi:hypothetical protein